MRPSLLRIDRADSSEAAVLVLGGEIDLSSAHLLADGIEAAVDQGWQRVVLDFGAITFVNSTGLGVMVAATKRLRADGGDLVARSFRGIPAAALAITGLDQFLTIES